jgi:hypothetical protein
LPYPSKEVIADLPAVGEKNPATASWCPPAGWRTLEPDKIYENSATKFQPKMASVFPAADAPARSNARAKPVEL